MMEEKSTAADQNLKKLEKKNKKQPNKQKTNNNIIKLKNALSSLAAASEQAKAPLQIH